MSTHLIIPDSHAHPDFNNDRFGVLGKFIVDLRPDVIVNLGDMADMPSLCSYDKGTKGFEGRRYKKDVEAVIDAQEKLLGPLKQVQKNLKKAKKKPYNPRMVLTIGNHEQRISKATSLDAVLDGTISLDDLKYKEYGWEVIPFLDVVEIDGVCYSHYFTSGVMSRPISGEHAAFSMITKNFKSCTQGHTHTRDFCERTDPLGNRIIGLVAGVYQDYWADFAGPANKMWWSGVIVKTNVHQGQYDLEFISMDTLKKEYTTNGPSA